MRVPLQQVTEAFPWCWSFDAFILFHTKHLVPFLLLGAAFVEALPPHPLNGEFLRLEPGFKGDGAERRSQ